MSGLIRGYVFVLLLITPAMGEPPKKEPDVVTIPLDEIWAYEMPGTRDVRELQIEKPAAREHGSLIGEIRRSLRPAQPEDNEVKACFAVDGTRLEALRGAHAVLVENKKPRERFSAGSEISLVFFSRQAGSYVHLKEVVRRENTIEIHYRFVTHRTREMTEHFALIAVGKLPVGRIHVETIQSSRVDGFAKSRIEPIPADWAGQFICKSFSFEVIDRPAE